MPVCVPAFAGTHCIYPRRAGQAELALDEQTLVRGLLMLLQYGAQKWCFEGRCQTLADRPVAIDGQWAEWASWSDCSRSCGAGVSQSERHCNNPQ